MNIVRILITIPMLCCTAAGFGMDTPKGNRIPKRFVNPRPLQISADFRATPDNNNGKDHARINSLKNLSPAKFISMINGMYHIKAYKFLYNDIESFRYLHELLYAIAAHPGCLREELIKHEQFNAYTSTLCAILRTSNNLLLKGVLLSDDSGSPLNKMITWAIALSEEILRNYSAMHLNKFYSVYEDNKKDIVQLRQCRSLLASIPAEYNAIVAQIILRKNNCPKAQESYWNKEKAQRLVERTDKIEAVKTNIEKLNKRLNAVYTAFKEFAEATDLFLTNRCCASLKLGKLSSEVLFEAIANLEENEAIRNLIPILWKKVETTDKEHLKEGFMDSLQFYVMLSLSNDSSMKARAKGFLWEAAVSAFLIEAKCDRFLSIGKEIVDKENGISCFIDQELTNCYIECKNCKSFEEEYKARTEAELDHTRQQLLKQRDIAEANGKPLVLISKRNICKGMQSWLRKKNITYICPATSAGHLLLGDLSALYTAMQNIE